MISIFFNTKKIDLSYVQHIKDNSKFDNEISWFENDGSVSLAESYNKFLLSANHDTIIFMHDDLILSKNFDEKILNHFENSDYGILGLAGTTNINKDGVWWSDRNSMCGRVWHEHNGNVNENRYAPVKSFIQEVACIDGLFIAVNRQKIEMGFDERFDGFHYYDIPFCLLNSKAGVKIGVVPDIKIVHKSIGQTNQQWENNKSQFVELFADDLPYEISPAVYVDELKFGKKMKAKVSIIIPTLENFEILKTCVNSIKKHTKHSEYEILIADTGSCEKTIQLIETELCDKNIHLHKFDYYHFGQINNQMIQYTKYPYILFCNNDIELKNDAISKMAEVAQNNKNVGTIGARLHYPNGLIQHGGVSLNLIRNNIFLSHKGIKTYYQAEFKRLKDIFANTAAFLMMKKALFKQVGGFIEHNKSAFEDVILNIECIKRGKQNIYCGDAVCIHHESLSRGNAKTFLESQDMKNIMQPYLLENMKYVQKFINK